MLRVCRRNGWSIQRDWMTLSGGEQMEWLADDARRQRQLAAMAAALESASVPDVGALVAVMLES